VTVLLLLFHEILSETAHDGTTNTAQEAMILLATEMFTCEASANGTEQTSILLRHWRGIWIVMRRIRIAGLSSSLRSTCLRWCAGHLGLIRLVGGIRILLLTTILLLGTVLLAILSLLAVLLLLLPILSLLGITAIVSSVALWVTRIICTVLHVLLAVLESTLAWRTVRVLSPWWAEFLCAVAALLVVLLRVLARIVVTLLGIGLLGLAVLRLLSIRLAVWLVVVRARHRGYTSNVAI